MKKTIVSVMVISAMLMCGSCGVPSSSSSAAASSSASQNTTAAAGSQAGGILGSLLMGLIGENTQISQANLVGTWNYQAPKCMFETENFLMKAGGQIAATQVENKLAETFAKVGVKPGACSYTFDAEGNYTMTIGGRNINGTYTLDPSTNTIKMSALLGLANTTATVQLVGNNLCLLYDADKLLALVSGVGTLSGNSTVKSVTSLLNSYDGMKVGFSLVK
ncbi:MAG: DUF4923 family protein [Clostridium sp.]|nr:DUF4923 family protein [Clostridium sp.]